VAQALINIERYELGLDYLQRYHEKINAVTVDKVQAAAQRWLDPDHYALAVAGPALTEG
jgi:zinc protease